MKQNRILIAESGSGYGGSAKYLANLLLLLDREQFQVEIAAYGSGPFIQKIKEQNVSLHHVSLWRFPWNDSVRGLLYMIFGVFQIVLSVPLIGFWLWRKRFELVHICNEIISHLPLLIAARLVGIKTICHMHGWREMTVTEKWASRFVNQFAAVTQSGADFYSWQLKGRTVLGIPNGILSDDEEFLVHNHGRRAETREKLGLKENEILAVVVGRLIPLKGHPVFFQALAQAKNNFPLLRGLVVGSDPSPNGEYRKKLEEELQTLGIKKQVQFLPWQDHLGPIYEASDIILQPSIEAESFGYVALEGMMAGKPVIASRIGGLIDVVKEGETGFLVKAGNAGELAEAILKIACDPKLGFQLGERGRERAKTVFTMERNTEQIMSLYGRLLDGSSKDKTLTSRQVLNRTAKQLIHKSGFLSAARKLTAGKVPILMYHRISNEVDPFFPAVSCSAFLKQMAYTRRHYQVISLDELVSSWKQAKPMAPNSLVVTFDDGYASTWSLAGPILEHWSIPATIFLASDAIREKRFIWTDLLRWWFKLTPLTHYAIQLNGTYGQWQLETIGDRLRTASEVSEKLKTLEESQKKKILEQLEKELRVKRSELPDSWTISVNEIKRMKQTHVRIGAHTKTHPIMTRLSEEAARSEIFDSKKDLESLLSEEIKHFAYPNGNAGDFNETHERLITEAGFDSACSSILGLNDEKTNRYALRRVYACEEPVGVFACRLAGIGS